MFLAASSAYNTRVKTVAGNHFALPDGVISTSGITSCMQKWKQMAYAQLILLQEFFIQTRCNKIHVCCNIYNFILNVWMALVNWNGSKTEINIYRTE